jgi:hypothetical protein
MMTAGARSRTYSVSLVLLWASAVVARPAAAQAIVRLDLGTQVMTFADDLEIRLPLTVNAQAEGPVHVAVEAGYPAKSLTFAGVKPGSPVEKVKGTVRIEEKPGKPGSPGSPDSDEQILTIVVESPEPLVAGTLATLTFRVAKGASHGDMVVRAISRTAKGAAGQTLETRGTDGRITLMPAIAPCFFYMH